MRRAGLLAAAALCAAACASGRKSAGTARPAGTATAAPTATSKATGTASPPAKPSASRRELLARAADAWDRRDEPGSLDEAIRLWEEAASQPPAPAEALIFAARGRRLRFERAGLASPDGLHETARDASACADDARRAWGAIEPDAAAAAAAGQPLGDVLARIGGRAAEPLYLEALCTAAWARAQGFTPLI
ncbi:MAG: hypothetical protein E6J64_16390, partial [Deltaproteobacteria bacterium]